ncbi:MAG: hypothetical protein Q9188_006431 [Gyalolechia gomerana]
MSLKTLERGWDFLAAVLLSLLAYPVLTTCKPVSKSLQICATQALLGEDAPQRIVTAQDDTYTDARLGEKIHFSAYSSLNDTLVIDLAHLNYVHVSEDHSAAKVGAGIRLGALYTALSAYDTTWVGGICPTVGLTGLLGAGGFNMQMRALGISSDHVLSAQVITADGETLTASPSSNPDLFWAIRGGGGGTYGVITELELRLRKLPRSAMVAISWNDTESRFATAKRFLEWAPRQPKEFTSQINVLKTTVQVLGWYLGGTKQELQALIDDSGLLQIGQPESQVSGDCSTDNSRIFGVVTNECLPDEKVDASILNVIPEPFSQYENSLQFTYEENPLSTTRATAEPWARFRRLSKSFFVQKDNLLDDDTLREIVDRIAQLDEASEIWAEWHAWNISATGDNAFAWREQAYAHLEFQAHGSNDSTTQAGYEKWFADLESYLRPAVGLMYFYKTSHGVDEHATDFVSLSRAIASVSSTLEQLTLGVIFNYKMVNLFPELYPAGPFNRRLGGLDECTRSTKVDVDLMMQADFQGQGGCPAKIRAKLPPNLKELWLREAGLGCSDNEFAVDDLLREVRRWTEEKRTGGVLPCLGGLGDGTST